MTGVIRRTVSSATATTSSGFNHGGLSSSSSSACPSTRGAMSTNKVLCTTTTTATATSNTQHHGSQNRLVSSSHLSNLLSAGKEIHKKLDRSFSEPAEKKNNAMAAAAAAAAASSTNLAPSSRYKTELCRSFAEIGTCKYGDKCQFAHGEDELRTITRHPKFKTENCKSFHSTGFCPYGPRCHFIHNDESKRASTSNTTPASGSTGTLSSHHHHHHHQQQQQAQARHFESALAAKQSSNAGAGNFATAMSEMDHHHHHLYSHPPPHLPFMTSSPTAVASIVGTTVVRPKALSLGSYSLGSSGEISLPSSQSGSPTSLNSFFNDENAAAFGFGASALRMGSSAVSGGNAFSFSPDSAFISFTQAHSPPNSAGLAFASSNATSKDMFGVSEPMNIDETTTTTTNSLISSLFSPNGDAAFGEASSINDYLFRSMSPPGSSNKSHPMLYPSSPESPVDSVASEIEALKLGEAQPSTFSPISSSSVFSSSSLSVSSGSPSSGLTDAFSSFQTSNISRLPTFTKFAATATIN